MNFNSADKQDVHADFKPKRKKILFWGILSAVILLAVITAGLTALLSRNSAHASDPVTNTGSSLSAPSPQNQSSHYPDPSNQTNLPDSVKVTAQGETVLLRASVQQGSQIYECQASKTDPSGYAWKFQAPSALLKADNGTNVIHSADPTWLYTEDGSEVEGQVGQYREPNGTRVAANATPDANSVPWLRLDVIVHRGNIGLFSNVNQIQRLYTAGGNAPKAGCDRNAASNHLIQSVSYTAEYVFWGHE